MRIYVFAKFSSASPPICKIVPMSLSRGTLSKVFTFSGLVQIFLSKQLDLPYDVSNICWMKCFKREIGALWQKTRISHPLK